MYLKTSTLLNIAQIGAIGVGVYFGYKLIIKPVVAVENVVGDVAGDVMEVAKETVHGASEIAKQSWEEANNVRKSVLCQYTPARWQATDIFKACGDVRQNDQIEDWASKNFAEVQQSAAIRKGSFVQHDPRTDGLMCELASGGQATYVVANDDGTSGVSFDAAN